MNVRPGEGERRAAGGYRPQYMLGARAILDALESGNLEAVRIADPEAGRVDDLQVLTPGRVDAYQIKWARYGGTLTLRDLVRDEGSQPSLMGQLADGWKRLQEVHAARRVVVHLLTNKQPSPSTGQSMPQAVVHPSPYHFAAFIKQAWRPAHHGERVDLHETWAAVWQEVLTASGLSSTEFAAFVQDCVLQFDARLPEEDRDVLSLVDLLFSTAANAEHRVELSRQELLQRLGWSSRYDYRAVHEFPPPRFPYRPIQGTVKQVEAALAEFPGGYLGVFGPPGSGKSTLLAHTLRALPVRLFPYYAFVPDAQDPAVTRGESVNFLHDITLAIHLAGIDTGKLPDPSDRSGLLSLFHRQLQALGDDHDESGCKTVILIDGLDHIEREQRPERSLLQDLPVPEAVPDGVYIIVGSQTAELADLPARVHYALQQEKHQIKMERLGPSDVQAITEAVIPSYSAEQRQRVFALSDGHPLALTYLLNSLLQASGSDEQDQVLDEAVPYLGDIESQYWAHWRAIQADQALVHVLGLLARIRGPIPVELVVGGLDVGTLRSFKQLLATYFSKEGENRWIIFHNSFRLFLADRTSEPLPGQSRRHQNAAYHRELANLFDRSPTPWRWEALYHLYCAEDYDAVLEVATAEWFREQVEALRPLDAIQTDVRLALKAAGARSDVLALGRLTLIGASLEQRSWILEDRSVADLLLEADEAELSAMQLRDGNRLRVDADRALRLSVGLMDAGLRREGGRIFELAEPLELLSGRMIPDDHTRPQNLFDLLSAWVGGAIVFRHPEQVTQVIRRISIEPGHGQDKSVAQASRDIQNWLLFQGAVACSEREDWTAWQSLFDELDEERDRPFRFFTLLRSAQRLEKAGHPDQTRSLLARILSDFRPEEFEITAADRWSTDARLAVAELALRVAADTEIAQAWLAGLPPIPLQDESLGSEDEPPLHQLRFRFALLRYLLGEQRQPEALCDEAEAHTAFGAHSEQLWKEIRRQISLAVLHLARLSAWGRLSHRLGSSAFLQAVRWILELLGPGWMLWPVPARVGMSGARSAVLRYIVSTAVEHGHEVLSSLSNEFERRWTDPVEGPQWGDTLQRDLVVALVEAAADEEWAEAQLRRIEAGMFANASPRDRVEQCEAQARAWLALRKQAEAREEVRQMVMTARGVLDDRDYQLPAWVKWLGWINTLEPASVQDRTRLMLHRLFSIQGYASGVDEAFRESVEVVFRWSPDRAVSLLKELLEHQVVDHQGGMTSFLMQALRSPESPTREIQHAVVDLILPLILGTEPELVEELIVQTANSTGIEAALHAGRYLRERIEVDAPATSRSVWCRAVTSGLSGLAVEPSQVDLWEEDFQNRADAGDGEANRCLFLKGGKCLTPDEVEDCLQTADDLRDLLEEEDRERSGSFDWAGAVEALISGLSSAAELGEIESVIVTRLSEDSLDQHKLSQSLTSLSRRFMELGDSVSAWNLAERALDHTRPSGWDPYFDGGAKHAALRQLTVLDSGEGRRIAIRQCVSALSEQFPYPNRILVHLDDVFEILIGSVPIQDFWPLIEEYLDELFATTLTGSFPAVDALFEEPKDATERDSPARAVARLLALHLDHPSYVVAQGAVRACTAAVLDESEAMGKVLEACLAGSDQASERALMALEAAALDSPACVAAFEDTLEGLLASPNLSIRRSASSILAQLRGRPPSPPPPVKRDTPVIYSLSLPHLAFHRTEEYLDGDGEAVAIRDPALALCPLDIEARLIARIAGVPEDNVLYRAVQLAEQLGTRRTWLSDDRPLTEKRVSQFLDQVGLRHTFTKVHISPARQALSYIVAELYDGSHLSPQQLDILWDVLIYYDPAFIRWRPERRPDCVGHIGSIPADDRSYYRLPDEWRERASESLALLRPRTSDGQTVLAEWTRLRRVDHEWPEEERVAMVRAVAKEDLWSTYDVESGHPPFARFGVEQVKGYSDLSAPTSEFVIMNEGYPFETPGTPWLAFNPAVASVLKWQPLPGRWFRWADARGVPVVESIWWNDGPFHQHTEGLREEVGTGWLVLATEQGFDEIRRWTDHFSRGGVVWRRLGIHGRGGQHYACGNIGFG